MAAWTTVSRLTGFARVIAIAAALGPGYLGNTYLASSFLPTLVLELLTGSLLGTLLIPSLVRAVDSGDRARVDRLAGGFLGTALLGFSAAAVLAIAAAPLIVGALAVTVDDADVASEQFRAGWLLLAMMMVQVPLYGVVAVGASVMNAHGRFALAAAAPVVENLAVMATMGAVVLAFGAGTPISHVGTAQLLVLGLGTTGAVALHAGVQWWGARRTGVRLAARAGWKDPEVREVLRRIRAVIGHAALSSGRSFAALVAANAVPGGVVALRVALNFFYLPLAVAARPVALTFLPGMSRQHHRGALKAFRDDYVRGLGLVLFLSVPAGLTYAVLSRPLADAAAFGEMAGSAGPELVAACLAGLALGVVAEAAFLMSTHAAYARDDSRSPFGAMVAGTAVSLAGLAVAPLLGSDTAILLALTLALSGGMAVSAGLLGRRLRRALPPGTQRLLPSIARAGGASLLMVGPAYAVAAGVSAIWAGSLGAVAAVAAAAALGAAIFVLAARAWRSPELGFYAEGFRRLSSRPGSGPAQPVEVG